MKHKIKKINTVIDDIEVKKCKDAKKFNRNLYGMIAFDMFTISGLGSGILSFITSKNSVEESTICMGFAAIFAAVAIFFKTKVRNLYKEKIGFRPIDKDNSNELQLFLANSKSKDLEEFNKHLLSLNVTNCTEIAGILSIHSGLTLFNDINIYLLAIGAVTLGISGFYNYCKRDIIKSSYENHAYKRARK